MLLGFPRLATVFHIIAFFLGVMLIEAASPTVDLKDLPDTPKPTEGPIPSKKTDGPTANNPKKLSQVEEARLLALGINPKNVDLKTIKRMEVFKMATPDKDADILGGTLKLRFRPVFNRSKPIINSNMWLTRFEDADTSGKFAAFNYGKSLQKNTGIPGGFSVGYTYDVDVIPKSVLARDWVYRTNENGETLLTIEDVLIEKEMRHRVRHALSANFDFKLTDNAFIFVKNYIQQMDQNDMNRSDEYKFSQGDYVSFDGKSGLAENSYIVRKVEDRTYTNDFQSHVAGFFHESDRWENELQVQYKHYTFSSDSYWDSYFENTNLDLAFDNADQETIDLYVLSPADENETNDYVFGDLRLMEMEDSSSDIIVNGDSARKWEVPWGELRFKTGIKYFERDFKSTENRWNYDAYDGDAFVIASLEDPWSENNVGYSKYSLAGFPNGDQVQQFFGDNKAGFVYNEANSRSQADPANYNVIETVSAVYMMLDNRWNKLRVVAGARFEETQDEFRGKEVLLDDNGEYLGTNDTYGERSYRNLFPGVHSIYNINSDLVFFSSWSRALKRPQFNYLAPFRKIIHKSQFISEGNPDLEPTIFDNLLVALDYNYSDTGFLKMEYLIRDYSDIVIKRRTYLEEAPFEGYRKDTWENVGSANLKSLDVRVFQSLSVINDFLSDLSVEVRYTHNDSSSNTREDEDTPLTYTPKSRIQGTFKYTKDALEIKAKVNYREGFLSQVGEEATLDHYFEAQQTYDILVEYRVDNGITGIFGVDNLTNEGTLSYLGDPSRPMDFRNNGRVWKAGLRYRY